MTNTKPDTNGNTIAREGCDRCACGCKYWENDKCVDCGAGVPRDIVHEDSRVRAVTGGGSHDWIHTNSQEDADALIAEYGLTYRIKYPPREAAGVWSFAIV